MKKLLALVLALVMTLSLCVVSSNAAYDDAADIDYKEAVDVMSAIGVLQGSDGKFDPKGTLTREQGAKIITYMLLGKTAADALTTPSAPFADVAADRWSAGSIAYAVSQGILAGVGNGKFDPTGALTNAAFAKMLLVALGYDAEIEGLIGGDWTLKTASLVNKIGLADDLGGVSYNAAITREQAAQFGLNTLKATLVQYDKSRSVGTNGSSVNTDLQASYVGNNAEAAANGYRAPSGTATPYTQFCEEHFSKLKLNTAGADEFGRNSNVWTLAGVKVGTYENEATLTYTENLNTTSGQKQVKADLKGYLNYNDNDVGGTNNSKIKAYVNGMAIADLTNTDLVTELAPYTGNGRLVEIFTKDNIILRVVVTDTLMGEVSKVDAAEGEITIKWNANGTGIGVKPDANMTTTKGYGTFAKGDYVLVTMTTTDAAGDLDDASENTIETVTAPEKITGIASRKSTSDNSITIAGTAYKQAYNCLVGNAVTNFLVSSQYDATLYLDQYGYVVYAKSGTAATKDTAIAVTKAYFSLNDSGELTPMVKGVTSNGETVTWEISKVNTTAQNSSTLSAVAGTLYTYEQDSNNKYMLSDYANSGYTWGTDDTYGDGKTVKVTATMAKGAKSYGGLGSTAYFADDAKVIYYSGTKATVVSAVPALTAATVYMTLKTVDTTQYITAMYIPTAAPGSATSNGDVVFVGARTGETSVTGTDGVVVSCYLYTAYINGEKVEDFYSTNANAEPGFYYVNIADKTGAYSLTDSDKYAATTGDYAVASGDYEAKTTSYLTVDPTDGGSDLTFTVSDAAFIDLVTNDDGTGKVYTTLDSMENVTAGNNRYLFVMYDADDMKAAQVYAVGGLYTMTGDTDDNIDSGSLDMATVADRTYAFSGQTVKWTVTLTGTTGAAAQADTVTITASSAFDGTPTMSVTANQSNSSTPIINTTAVTNSTTVSEYAFTASANVNSYTITGTGIEWTVTGTVGTGNITMTNSYSAA